MRLTTDQVIACSAAARGAARAAFARGARGERLLQIARGAYAAWARVLGVVVNTTPPMRERSRA